jgi:hypothetical protein
MKEKIKYDPVKKHYKHPISIEMGSFGPHKAKFVCQLCKEFVKWASKDEIRIYKEIDK